MNNTLILGNEYTVFRIGLGTNRITNTDKAKDALKKAVELGINFIDTASAYTGGISEEIIGDTLAPYNNIVIASKGGMHPPDFRVDSRPESLRHQLENSLQKLHLTTIPLYFLHRVDPKVPFTDQIMFLKKAQNDGRIKHIGLSEVSVEQIKEAQKEITVAAVENEYNLSQRKYDDVINYCQKHGIVFVPFFPLHVSIHDEQKFETLQQKYHATRAQLALAWLLKRSRVMLPIPGSLSMQHLEENVKAAEIDLDDEDFKTLQEIA